jgi:Uri superfamily endonuclease
MAAGAAFGVELPVGAGSYALLLALDVSIRLAIGRLGVFDFPAGPYLYLGSAYGPGGLRARIGHHLQNGTKPRWHLDYLRGAARIEGVWIVHAVVQSGEQSDPTRGLECRWSQALVALPGAVIPALGFGASDCTAGCSAHCAAFPAGLEMARIEAALQTQVTARSASNTPSGVGAQPVVFMRIDDPRLADR